MERAGDVKKNKRDYTIGLDIGTASVGWAVIDDDFNLLQAKKNIRLIDEGGVSKQRKKTNMWGALLFPPANTAAERRLKRGARRRIVRRAKRLQYLREIFAPEITKFDNSFYIRLDESFYQNDDSKNKTIPTQYPLFNGKTGAGETFSDEKEYYNKYPTIYHLRDRLARDPSQADIRLVFLALSHIVKFRGHFVDEDNTALNNGDFTNVNIRDSVKSLIDAWNNYSGDKESTEAIAEDHEIAIEEVLKENISPTYKRNKIENVLNIKSSSAFSEIIRIFVGNQGNVKKSFGLNEDLKISASAEDFEEKISILTDEQQEIILLAQKVNGDMLLDESLLDGSLSKRMIEKYNTHQEQLRELKDFAKTHSVFSEIFGPEDGKKFGIYTKYIQGVGNPAKTYGVNIDEFYKELKKIIISAVGEESPFAIQVAKQMELGNYLPKQRVYTNGAIPFQVHRDEMKKIIANQRQYYLDIEWDKIVPLMQFRIPYYIGTLAKTSGWVAENGTLAQNEDAFAKNSWVVRRSDNKLTPWNFDDVIDRDASALNFIERMTGFDTYLPTEKVLPAKSLTYQKYAVLNELSKVRVGEEFLSSDKKKRVFNELFAGRGRSGRVSKSELVKFLDTEFIMTVAKDDIRGLDGKDFNASFTTFHDFECIGIDFEKLSDENNFAKFDDISKMQTIFEDKKALERQIRKKYSDFLSEDEIVRLSKKHYTGWGSLSRKLLTGMFDRDGHNILWFLLNDSAHRNFQQLITDDSLPFEKMIADANSRHDRKGLTYDVVENLAGSPALKRGIWQSLRLVDEIVSYMGYKPKNIAIEFARENQGSQVKDSRKSKIEKIVDALKDEFGKDAIDKKVLNEYDNKDFTQRLQLYFLQNGKDMYDGSGIDINKLSEYDIDHIYPRSLIKDDSIDNKVLVSSANNRKKGDRPAGEVFGSKMSKFWYRLERAGAISEKKLARLNKQSFSKRDFEGFINRQLVETRQIMKNVALILNDNFGDEVNVITLKSQFAHELRKQNGWAKNRDVNDFHHAHDAYLNAVVGVFRQRMGFDDFAKKLRQNYKNHSADELKRQAALQMIAMDVWNYKGNELLDTYVDTTTGETKHLYEKVRLNNNKTWTDTTTGEIWWSSDVLARIEKALSYRDVNIVRKTFAAKGAYSLEGNLKKGYGTVKTKNNRDISRYGGSNLPSTSITVLEGGVVKGVPLQKKNRLLDGVTVIANGAKFIDKDGYLRTVASPSESSLVQQFAFSIQEVRSINSFIDQKANELSIDSSLVEKILGNIRKNGVKIADLTPALLDRPVQNVVSGSSIKQYGQIAIVADLLKLMAAGGAVA